MLPSLCVGLRNGTHKEWIARSGIATFTERYSQTELLAHGELTVTPNPCPVWLERILKSTSAYFDRCVDMLDSFEGDLVLRHLRSTG